MTAGREVGRKDAQLRSCIIIIKELRDLPAGVIGFEAAGKIKTEDFRDVVLPVVVRASDSGEFRVVIVVTEFLAMTGGALWEDLKLAIPQLAQWKRIAVVSDTEWIAPMTNLFGWMKLAQIKTFSLSQRTEAIEWASATNG